MSFTETLTTLSYTPDVLTYTDEDGAATNIDLHISDHDWDQYLINSYSGTQLNITGGLSSNNDEVMVYMNGLALANGPTYDYTISGNIIQLTFTAASDRFIVLTKSDH